MLNHYEKKSLIMLTAGGTGGHVYPAESLATELLKQGYDVMLITDARGKNNYKGKLGQITNFSVQAGAVVGKSKWFKVKSLCKTAVGILQAVCLLWQYKPKCVVGFGGYASFPASVAAILLRVPLVLHEQNSVMSRTNRYLCRFAKLIALSFPQTKFAPAKIKTAVVGMPIRENIANVKAHAYNGADKMQVLVLGGSQGATVFSQIIPQAVAGLPAQVQKKLKIVQQAPQTDVPMVKDIYAATECEAEVSHFFENMPQIYAGSDIMFSRAGASSVFEILAVQIPSVLVPLPYAADNHQFFNAKYVSDAKAAVLAEQSKFSKEFVQNMLQRFLNSQTHMAEMRQNCQSIAVSNSAELFADAIKNYVL